MSLPTEQIIDAHKMEADGLVHLYEIQTSQGTLYYKADNTVVWDGNTYSGIAIQIDGRSQNTDGQWSRPSLTIANPLGLHSAMAAQGAFDNAIVVEKRVMYEHILSNSAIFLQRKWKCRLVSSVNRISITLQLREYMDGPRFILPARQFVPPDFPSVTV